MKVAHQPLHSSIRVNWKFSSNCDLLPERTLLVQNLCFELSLGKILCTKKCHCSSVLVECVHALMTLKAKGHSVRVFHISIKRRTIDLTFLSLCASKLGCP